MKILLHNKRICRGTKLAPSSVLSLDGVIIVLYLGQLFPFSFLFIQGRRRINNYIKKRDETHLPLVQQLLSNQV